MRAICRMHNSANLLKAEFLLIHLRKIELVAILFTMSDEPLNVQNFRSMAHAWGRPTWAVYS